MCRFSRVSGWLLALSGATVLLAGGSVTRGAGPLEVFAVSDAVRVFEDGYGCPEQPGKEIRVFGLRGETISCQCVVRAAEDLAEVSVSVGALKQDSGSGLIPTEKVQWNFVSSIFIQENTRKVRKTDITRPAPARFPDCLSEEPHCAIGKGALKAVYLTIGIPAEAEPGEYRGAVTVSAGQASQSLPVLLKVYPLTLPAERHLMVTEWFSTKPFQKHHDVDPSDTARFEALLRVYAQNMAEHRQNMFRVSTGLVKATQGADGGLRFDFSAFDRWAQLFWDTGCMDLMETGFVAHFGEGGWSSREVLLSGASVTDESSGKQKRLSGEEYLPQFLPAFVAHLREKGWLEKTVFHIADEPSSNNIMSWREASDFVHRHAPQLRRMDAIETPHCLDRLEVWVPKLDHLAAWQEAYEEAQRRGNELWFYTVGIYQQGSVPNKTVDVALIESRVMHWLNYRYGLKGYLHWGLNAWTDDPWNDPGKHRGDGWHVYPKKEGLLNSLRWEQMRNGIQDYECLWLLENKIAQLRCQLAGRVAELIVPDRRPVEIASQVVASYSNFQRDPEVLYAARRQAIEETLALEESPKALLQTIPREYSEVAGDYGIDIVAWVEPGTTVKINGRKTPVADDGLVMAQVPVSKEGTISLEAEKDAERKTLVRKFRVR